MALEGSKDFVFNIKTKLDDSTKQALGAVDQIVQSLKGSAMQAEAALKAAVTQGLDPEPARQALEKLNTALKTLKGNKDAIGNGKDPLQAFEGQLDRAAQQADMLGAKIKIVEQRIMEMNAAGASSESVNAMQGQLRKLNEEQAHLNSGTQGATRSYGQFRNSVQNASYQITDFMVQVQGGTSAVKALSQQGSQLLAGFGAWGAAAGLAVTGLTILWEVIQRNTGGTEALGKEIDRLNKHLGELTAEGKNFDLSKMRQELRSTLADVRALAGARLGIFQQESMEVQAKSVERLKNSVNDFGRSVVTNFGPETMPKWMDEFIKDQNVAKAAGTVDAYVAFSKKWGDITKDLSDRTKERASVMREAAQQVVSANENVLKAGQTYTGAELRSRQLSVQTELEGALAGKVRERGQLQVELNNELAKGAQADSARVSTLKETLRLTDLAIQKEAESSSAIKERTKATDHGARVAELAAKQHAALIDSQDKQLSSLVGGISKVDAARKRLEDIQKLQQDMIKAGNASGNSSAFGRLISDAQDKLDTAKFQEYIESLQGVDKGYALANESVKKFAEQGKVDGAVMDGRIQKLHEIANAAEDYGKALRENMKAAGVDQSALSQYDQVAVRLSAMKDAAAVSGSALSELTLQFETGNMSLETYIALWQQLGGKMDDLATKNPTAYFDNLTKQFEDQKKKLAEMPAGFDAYAEKAKLSAGTIEEMKNKFPQLSSESDKALTKLKSQLGSISMNALSDALSGNVKSWREWGANVLKQLGEVLIKWGLMQAAMKGASAGAGTWWGSALGALSGATQADAPGASAPVMDYTLALRSGPNPAPPPDIIDTSAAAVSSAVMNMRGTQANPGRMSGSGTKVEVNNYSDSKVETQTETDQNGMEVIRLMIRNQVTESLSNGSMDRAMRMNYGLRRNPI